MFSEVYILFLYSITKKILFIKTNSSYNSNKSSSTKHFNEIVRTKFHSSRLERSHSESLIYRKVYKYDVTIELKRKNKIFIKRRRKFLRHYC